MGLASFLRLLRAKCFYLYYCLPLNTCTDSPGTPGRRQASRHGANTFDGHVTWEVWGLSFLRTFHQVTWRRPGLASACPPLHAVGCMYVCMYVFIKLHIIPPWQRCPLQATATPASFCLLSFLFFSFPTVFAPNLFWWNFLYLVTTTGFVADQLIMWDKNNVCDFVCFVLICPLPAI